MSEPEEPRTERLKVQAGITVTGEFVVEAEDEEAAREVAKRKIKQEPLNYGKVSDEFTNNVFEWV